MRSTRAEKAGNQELLCSWPITSRKWQDKAPRSPIRRPVSVTESASWSAKERGRNSEEAEGPRLWIRVYGSALGRPSGCIIYSGRIIAKSKHACLPGVELTLFSRYPPVGKLTDTGQPNRKSASFDDAATFCFPPGCRWDADDNRRCCQGSMNSTSGTAGKESPRLFWSHLATPPGDDS